jgi:hypothetical protein
MADSNVIDYAYPTMMAERSLKDLHNAMLENRLDDALMAGLNALVEVRLALIAIKDAAEKRNADAQALTSDPGPLRARGNHANRA